MSVRKRRIKGWERERERDMSGRKETEREPEKKRHGGREKVGRERGEIGVRER